MNQQAIEAAAKELEGWLLGYRMTTIERIAQKALEAARPHLEAELRAQIAEEIRTLKLDTRDHCTEEYNAGIDNAARIVVE